MIKNYTDVSCVLLFFLSLLLVLWWLRAALGSLTSVPAEWQQAALSQKIINLSKGGIPPFFQTYQIQIQ